MKKTTINLPYGNKIIKASIKKENILRILEPYEPEIINELEKIKHSLKNPVKSKNFIEFLKDAENVLIVVDDWTRFTPTEKALEAIYPYIKNKKVKILIATGVHKLKERNQLQYVLGRFLEIFKDKIYINSSYDDTKNMVYFGRTSRGTEVFLNKLIQEASHLITFGSVIPHWFAGFSGGRKSFLPGVSSFKTIQRNHGYAIDSKARLLNLDGNPVHEDMMEVLGFLEDKQIFSIQLALWKDKIYQCIAGNIKESFFIATKKTREIYSVEIQEKADIVVSVNPDPLCRNLYNTQKTLESGKLALKKGGILILVSQCNEGIGDKTFFDLLAAHKSPREAIKNMNRLFAFRRAYKIAELAQVAEIWGITDLSSDILKKVFIRSCDSFQGAIDQALAKKGPDSKILFIMDGNLIVPVLK